MRAGHGLRAIAIALNADGAVCPRPQQHRPTGWAPSSVRAILYRPLYRGEIVWNRTKKRNQWGIKEQRARPETDWVRLPAPELRIVSDELWNAAHARLAGSRETYVRGTGGRLWGRPPNGVMSKYLLTGLARCGRCGGTIMVRTRASGRRRTAWYACSSYHRRGSTVCTNALEAPLDAVDAALFDMLETNVLSTEVLEDVTTRVVEHLKALAAQPTHRRRDELKRERSLMQLEVARLTAAIASGGDVPSLVAALRERDARLAGLTRELEVLAAPATLAKADRRVLERQVRARLTEWRSLLRRQVGWSRQLVQKLIDGHVILTPTEDGRAYALTASLTLGRAFSGVLFPKALVSPTGFGAGWTAPFWRVVRRAA